MKFGETVCYMRDNIVSALKRYRKKRLRRRSNIAIDDMNNKSNSRLTARIYSLHLHLLTSYSKLSSDPLFLFLIFMTNSPDLESHYEGMTKRHETELFTRILEYIIDKLIMCKPVRRLYNTNFLRSNTVTIFESEVACPKFNANRLFRLLKKTLSSVV